MNTQLCDYILICSIIKYSGTSETKENKLSVTYSVIVKQMRSLKGLEISEPFVLQCVVVTVHSQRIHNWSDFPERYLCPGTGDCPFCVDQNIAILGPYLLKAYTTFRKNPSIGTGVKSFVRTGGR